MPRAYWSGQIRLALVSIPVEIYSATKSGSQISFRQIHEPSGKPVKYEKVVPGIGPVDPDEILKGFEVEKGTYVLLEQDEIDAVKLESKKTLALTQFVDHDEISVLYFDKPYYVVPADELAEEAYIVLREALRQTKKIGLGQLALRGTEHLVSLKPCGAGMILETLRYADEVTRAANFFGGIDDAKPDAELLSLAETLISKKTAAFDASAFHNGYVDALHKLIEQKRRSKSGKVLEDVDEGGVVARGDNVLDLMAALKKSVSGEKSAGGKKRSTTSKRSATARKRA